MEVIRYRKDLQDYLGSLKEDKPPLALVPTMGYLHAGHESLFSHAKELGTLGVSIFVNPLQFNESSDYTSYPRDTERDLEICKKNGAQAVFIPSKEEMYPKEPALHLTMPSLTNTLCGRERPGHFEGVLLVVLSLFNLFRPAWAVFGKKDYQQYVIIKRMALDLNLPVQIIGAETLRNADGLAYSSRNARLSPEGRKNASLIYRALKIGQKAYKEKQANLKEIKEIIRDVILSGSGNAIGYVEAVDIKTLERIEKIERIEEKVKVKSIDNIPNSSFLLAASVLCEGVRLIDNLECTRS